MTRPVRVEFPNAIYFITARAAGDEALFRDDDDRALFLGVLSHVVLRYHWNVWSYALLKDEYLLLIETPEANLSKGMRQLGGLYTQRFNEKHGRGGKLFGGRYKSLLVERGDKVKEVSRYVAFAPVRAKLSTGPEFYIYSSHRPIAGLARRPDWLDADGALKFFGSDEPVKSYTRYVYSADQNTALLPAARRQLALGGDDLLEKSEKLAKKKVSSKGGKRPSFAKLKRIVGKKFASKDERNLAVYSAYDEQGYTLEEIGEAIDLHYATISRIIKKVEEAK
ncbi:MAG: addiction module toxin RelE [Deltaproteobacteria bacterium]|nr:MAG: addiction module toxin RelE [Deltaproteobacteria bacterium]